MVVRQPRRLLVGRRARRRRRHGHAGKLLRRRLGEERLEMPASVRASSARRTSTPTPCASAGPTAAASPRARAWRARPRPPRSPGRSGARPPARAGAQRRQADHGREPRLDVAPARAHPPIAGSVQAADRAADRQRRPALAGRLRRLQAVEGAAARRRRRAMASARSSTSTAPASTTTPARPAAAACSIVRGPIAGMSTRSSWPGLGPFASTPRRTAGSLAAGQAGDPLQHGIGAFRALDGEHLAVRHHHGLAGIDGAQRLRARQSPAPRRRDPAPERHAAQRPAPASRSGATSCTPRTVEALALEEAHARA